LSQIEGVLAHPPRSIDDLGAGASATTHELVAGAFEDAVEYRRIFGDLSGQAVLLAVTPGHGWIRAFFAVLFAGAAAAPIPLGAPAAEVAHVASVVVPRFAIAESAFVGSLPEKLEVVAPRRAIGASDSHAIASQVAMLDCPAERAALILFTSGTTGKPKGAPLSHANLAAQVDALREAWGTRHDDVLLHALPMHHLHGIVVAFLHHFLTPTAIRMLPRFEATRVTEELGRATVWMGVPTFYQRLVDLADAMEPTKRRALESAARGLRLATSGSAALPAVLAERWRTLAGAIPLERYGMTEIGMALSNPLDSTARRRGFVGRPLPSVRVRIVDDAGRDSDGPGEVWVRGPSVFAGYIGRDPAEDRDGEWFKTGDVASRDPDGAIRLLGRKSSDILKTGGEKVSALEIEEVLREHPAVGEVAVVGVPDAEWGDRVVGFVVGIGDAPIDPDEIRAFAKSRLAPFKVPKQIRPIDALPRNAMGKVQKGRLVELLGTAENSRIR